MFHVDGNAVPDGVLDTTPIPHSQQLILAVDRLKPVGSANKDGGAVPSLD
jgi:hypothetical protein